MIHDDANHTAHSKVSELDQLTFPVSHTAQINDTIDIYRLSNEAIYSEVLYNLSNDKECTR